MIAQIIPKNYIALQKNEIPHNLAIPSRKPYDHSLTADRVNAAHLIPLNDKVTIFWDAEAKQFTINGMTFVEAYKQKQLFSACGNMNPDLPLFWTIYTLIGKAHAEHFRANHIDANQLNENYEYGIKINIRDLLEALGMPRNSANERISKLIDDILIFHKVIGVIPISEGDRTNYEIAPAISIDYFNVHTKELALYSPYISRLIYRIMSDAVGRYVDYPSSSPKVNKQSRPKPMHNYLMHMDICSERNKRAVEIVRIVTQIILSAGAKVHNPHISAKEIVNRCPDLEYAIANAKSKANINTILKRAFSRAWELLAKKTDLKDKYNNIKLPAVDDYPTSSTLRSKVYTFQHEGLRERGG